MITILFLYRVLLQHCQASSPDLLLESVLEFDLNLAKAHFADDLIDRSAEVGHDLLPDHGCQAIRHLAQLLGREFGRDETFGSARQALELVVALLRVDREVVVCRVFVVALGLHSAQVLSS